MAAFLPHPLLFRLPSFSNTNLCKTFIYTKWLAIHRGSEFLWHKNCENWKGKMSKREMYDLTLLGKQAMLLSGWVGLKKNWTVLTHLWFINSKLVFKKVVWDIHRPDTTFLWCHPLYLGMFESQNSPYLGTVKEIMSPIF